MCAGSVPGGQAPGASIIDSVQDRTSPLAGSLPGVPGGCFRSRNRVPALSTAQTDQQERNHGWYSGMCAGSVPGGQAPGACIIDSVLDRASPLTALLPWRVSGGGHF